MMQRIIALLKRTLYTVDLLGLIRPPGMQMDNFLIRPPGMQMDNFLIKVVCKAFSAKVYCKFVGSTC